MKSHRNLGNNSPIQKRAKSARNKINYTKSPFQPTEKKNVHSNANNPINHRMMQVSTPLKEMPKSNTCLETKPNSNSTFMLNFETQIPDSQTKLANVPEKSKEALIKELVKKIKPTFYGRRYKQLTKTNTQSSVNVFKAGRRISGQYFLIIISKSSDVYKLSLTKLGNADRVFEFPVSNLQIQKPEELIKQIQIKDNGDPYLNIPNGLVKSTLNPEKSQEQSFSKSTNEGAVNRSQSIKYKINLNPDPLSPQRTLPIKSIQKFMLSNDSLEFVNRSPLDSSRFIFKLILATSIMLNEIQTQLMIYLSPKYLKLQLKSLYETVEKVISIEDAAEILNIKKERLESNTDKLCMLIKKNNGLDFIVKSLSLHSDNSDNSLKTDLDESQEIVNIANKSSIDRKIDNVNYHLEGSKIDGIFTLKATKTCDNSVIYKSYSAEEMIKFFGSVVNVDSILAKITIIDKEILLL